MFFRGVVTLVAGICEDALEFDANLLLDLRDHCAKRMPIIWLPREGLGVDNELAAFRTIERRCNRDLDAELIRLAGLSFPDALDLRCMQTEDAEIGAIRSFDPAQIFVLSVNRRASISSLAKASSSGVWPLILRPISRMTRPSWVFNVLSGLLARLNCLACA